MDERALIERARRDRAAFGDLYQRHVDAVYAFAYRRTGSRIEAEDLTAETFRRALEAMPRFQAREAPFRAWLFTIASNLVRDRARRREPSEAPGVEPGAGDEAVAREQARALWALVDGLSPAHRRVIVLRFSWELSHAEVAQRLGCSPAAAKQLAHRALAALRRVYLAEGAGADGSWLPRDAGQ